MNPEDFRVAAMQRGLSREDLNQNPVMQFEDWYQATIETGLPEPNAMTLATVDRNGQPWARTVLLKLYDDRGFVFFTNYDSAKAEQIGGNPRVALLFPWVALGRQIQITGMAERIPTAESLRYFLTRPRGSQIGAWASQQSKVIQSRALLDIKVAEIQQRFAAGQVPLPAFWGGLRVAPETIEFWQARPNRLHDRFRYQRDAHGVWSVQRLAP
ncbi:pyridoxamine 5'-phosphate oxidase [Thioalkalicoccus limnaeus]|uniref:Pyridoxine/pyridoxamine 5'-phosphate oxidase n=1 Tax=Thioalkalicoccus limnaeus TaxID=120681 RepID=A0ABV4BEH5_9GAMM